MTPEASERRAAEKAALGCIGIGEVSQKIDKSHCNSYGISGILKCQFLTAGWRESIKGRHDKEKSNSDFDGFGRIFDGMPH